MKNALMTLILFASPLAMAHSFTAGTYKGAAVWQSKTNKGDYKATTVISPTAIRTHYVLPDGSAKDWNFELRTVKAPFFDVYSQGVKLGSGYCLEKALVCHYDVTLNALKIEETLVQQGAKLYRFGSKDEGQGPILWQEGLDKE